MIGALMKIKRVTMSILVIPALLVLAACGNSETGSTLQVDDNEEVKVSSIEGEVYYRERMMLPPGAELTVEFQDISRSDAMATVIATVMQPATTAPPYAFAIAYDPTEIDPRMRYALRATIALGDRLMFTSTEYIDPFAPGPIKILVQRVAEPVDKAAPVPAPAAPESKPASGGSAASDDAGLALWTLTHLAGEPAPKGAGGSPVELSMNPADGTAAGFSGCNRFTGSFSSDGRSANGTQINFGPLATTMRACAQGEELERAFLGMLDGVDAYRITGATLELLQGDQVVATFTLRG